MKLPTASYNQPGRNSSRLLNCYPQASTEKGPVEVVGCPGITSYVTPSYGSDTHTGRGLYQMKDSLYAVVGQSFYTVSGAVATRVGSVLGDSRLMLAGNGTQIVTDTGYIYDASLGTITYLSDPDRPEWSAVGFLDGYIVYTEANSGRFGVSDLNDASSYDALQYATAEGSPDNLITLAVDHRQIYLIGTDSIEIWWNAGTSGFPMERISGGFVELGGLARFGWAKADNAVFLFASDRTIRRMSGITPQKVSTTAIEERLATLSDSDAADCRMFSYTWEGHIHVVVRFPSATFVYDCTTNEWHERQTYGKDRWNVNHAVSVGGKVYTMDADTGAIGYLDATVNTEYGGILRREVTFPIVYAGEQRAFHSQLDLVFRTGDAPLGVTPYVTLQYSDDGGSTWRAMPDRELGVIGEYRKILRWNRLGYARDRVYRCALADNAPFLLTDTQLTVSGGAR